MVKKDKKIGEEKKRKDQVGPENEKEGSKQPKKENSEQVVKGKLKWSKDDEKKREKEQKVTDSVSTSSKKKEKSDQHTDQQKKQETTQELKQKKENIATKSSKENADKKDSSTKKKYTIEDTLGPIDFKEYSIDPETEKEENVTKEDGSVSTEKAKKKETSQDTKPFVFSNKEEKPSDSKKDQPAQQKRAKKEKKPAKEKRSSDKWKLAVKILWLPIVLLVVLIVSLIVGHTMIGDQPASDVFDLDMWLHLYKLIFTK